MEGVFCCGRETIVCRAIVGWRENDRALSRVWDLEKDGLQDLQSV